MIRRFFHFLVLLLLLGRPASPQAAVIPETNPATAVFADPNDPDYRKILAMCKAGKIQLEKIRRFDMSGFKPNPAYVREMKRFGVLPPDFDANRTPLDVYQLDRAYWDQVGGSQAATP